MENYADAFTLQHFRRIDP